jgi:tRNA pseudouridine55 synthase
VSFDGILNVYKESGWTSNDVVQKLRGILKTKKIGHGGTLDPTVTGVLPVAVGRATRLLEYMDEAGKAYAGEVTLGFATETEDAEGQIIARSPVSPELTEAEVDQAMTTFIGQIQQVPPMYSAVKINGKRLYEYARAGQQIERPSREVEIKSFVRTSPLLFDGDGNAHFKFRVTCSKGTYIRTLCVDLAQRLGYAGHMHQLSRTMANGLEITESKTLSEIATLVSADRLSEILQPLSFAVTALTKRELTTDEMRAVSDGKTLPTVEAIEEGERIALFYKDALVAVYEANGASLKAKKVLSAG